MKTIYTALPIYDKVAKQCYERSKHINEIIPIISARHRLPSFQWKDDGDGATALSKIEVVDETGYAEDITSKFTLPAMIPFDHDYFSYKGSTLNSLLNIGNYYLQITTNNFKVYYSDWFKVDCIFDDDLPPTEIYSTKYLILNFSNTCDLGDIFYHGGFTQSLFLESDTLEMFFPTKDEGQESGEGRYVRTFARQTKKYIAKSKIQPDYMVDVFNRLKLHNTIELIDLVGDTHTVYNLEVEHEWLFDDKFYAQITLTFDYDETVIVSGCCTNIT